MASRDGAVHHDQVKPKEQPARILLTGQRGGLMNINIGRITGSVTVGNRNHVTHYHHGGGSRKKGQSSTGHRSSDSESSSSDSESERERQSFFKKQGQGNVMLTKNQFKEMKRKMKEVKEQISGSGPSVRSLVVNKTTGTYALDSSGKSVPIQSQRVSSGPNMHPMGPVNQPQKSNNPPVNQLPADHQLTIYEQQTQKFENIMMELQNKIITETVIHNISAQLGKGWRRVFRHLDFSDDLIDRTFVESGQVQETVYKLLMKWTRVTDTPDVKKLVGALVRAEQDHIIYLLQD